MTSEQLEKLALIGEMMPDLTSVYLEGPNGDYTRLFHCFECGAAVIDRGQHFAFHKEPPGKKTA